MVRLIRSKGIGVISSAKIPRYSDVVLGQLGNRVQHALRAFTRAIRSGESCRRNVSAKSETESRTVLMSSRSAKRSFRCWMKMAVRRCRAREDCSAAQSGRRDHSRSRNRSKFLRLCGHYENVVDRDRPMKIAGEGREKAQTTDAPRSCPALQSRRRKGSLLAEALGTSRPHSNNRWVRAADS